MKLRMRMLIGIGLIAAAALPAALFGVLAIIGIVLSIWSMLSP